MKRLKVWIIHKLGGFTEEELGLGITKEKSATVELCIAKAKALYKKPADTWCKEMYEYLEFLRKFYMDEAEDITNLYFSGKE